MLCILIEIGPPAGRRARACHHFPSRNIAAHWQIAILLAYSPPLNSLDYGTWGVVQPKGKATAHLKMGALKQTVWLWQLQAAKVGDVTAKLPRAQAGLGEGLSPLAAAIVVSLAYH
jgi:hypothetical protein